MASRSTTSTGVILRPVQLPGHPPLTPTTFELAEGHQRSFDSRPLPCRIILDRDAVLTLRDDTKIRADIYRPKTNTQVPAIIMWGPYGKSSSGMLNLHAFPFRAGIPRSKLSGYESFEGLDPAEWVRRGYAIVNIDPRGIGDSEGNVRWWGSGEGRDGADAVEQIAKLDWCNGNVGMAGNSWLAMAQWYIAAERPRSLKCIAPLEGGSDPLRENFFRGGIEDLGFLGAIAHSFRGRQQQEDVLASFKQCDVSNKNWEDKRAKIGNIEVPAYIGASYSTNLHTIGSLRGFEEIPHSKKWLVLHATQEWHDLYSEERTEDLQRFFDRYLKDEENGWEATPPVRLSFLRFNQQPLLYKPFSDLPWELPQASQPRLYLQPDSILSTEPAISTSTFAYQADARSRLDDNNVEELQFTYIFPSKTALVGPSKAVLCMSAPEATDLDVYVQLRKADRTGTLLHNINIPFSDLGVESESEIPMISVLRYLGPQGMLRASRRHISPELSSPYWGTLSNSKTEPVRAGEVVQLEIWIWPTGIVFEKGEKLVLKVSGHNMGLTDFEFLAGSFENRNKGKHAIHLGGSNEGYLDFWTIDVE